MPITCKLLPLSDLFMFHPDKNFDSKKATEEFTEALDNYCKVNNCRAPVPDKPKPGPASVEVSKSDSFGGDGGGAFDWSVDHPILNARKIIIRSGS